jgi:AP-4 complex subunit sigma-1
MAYLEFIHNLVETMDKYFENVCELDVRVFEIIIYFLLDYV